MLVFALILLFFANHQSPSVLFQTFGAEDGAERQPAGDVRARLLHVALHRVRLRHRRHVRRGDGRREPAGAARRPVVDLDLAAPSASSSCWRSSCRSRTSRPRWPRAWPASSRSPPRSLEQPRPASSSAASRSARSTCSSSSSSVFVCTLAIQGAATRMMFSMGRDRHLPLGRVWGQRQPHFQTPANAAVAVGVLAALPILLVGPDRRLHAVDRGDRADLPELLPVQPRRAHGARARGWPHKRPGSTSAAGACWSTSWR